MNTISLSVYCITLYKRFKNKDLENLVSIQPLFWRFEQ